MSMASKSKNTHHLPSPLVVSTHCSSTSTLKSFYHSCRRHLSCSEPYQSYNPISRTSDNEWLSTEKKLTNCPTNFSSRKSGKGTTTADILRLGDGGYLHNLNYSGAFSFKGWPSEKLAMQVSAPAIIPVEIGSGISKVLHRMASMGPDNLINWLLKSIPMCNISNTKIDSNPIAALSEGGFSEAILVKGVHKLEKLALEGLKIQKGGKIKVGNEKIPKHDSSVSGDCLIQVMLIQLRDPSKGYDAVGEMMIGLIEANVGETRETGVLIQEIHVAGISREPDHVYAGGYLWSLSTRSLEGDCSSSKEMFARNPDISLAS